MPEDAEQRDNAPEPWMKISILVTSVESVCFFFSTGKAGGGSHEFQGMLSSSWDERGWEGEGASTGKVKSGRMRKDGNAAVVKAMPRVSRDGL